MHKVLKCSFTEVGGKSKRLLVHVKSDVYGVFRVFKGVSVFVGWYLVVFWGVCDM